MPTEIRKCLCHYDDFRHKRNYSSKLPNTPGQEASDPAQYGPGWNEEEDWAESVVASVYPDIQVRNAGSIGGSVRMKRHFIPSAGAGRMAWVQAMFNGYCSRCPSK
jgi:hypothetical protein